MNGQFGYRILIVDDHPLMRSAIHALIEDQDDLEVCGEAGDMTTALELFDAHHPDLILVDLALASGSGLGLIRQIAARAAGTRMLVLSMFEEKLFAERALRAGALGYIDKRSASTEVVPAIRQVLAGRPYFSIPVKDLALRLLESGSESGGGRGITELSDRELEVFQLIAQGLSTARIAEQLCISPKTVESHRENIKQKLEIQNSSELTRRAVLWWVSQAGDLGDSDRVG